MYATKDDLKNHLHPDDLLALADDDHDGAADDAILQAALDAAEAEIDLYLAGRYALPLADPPAVLSGLCVTLVAHRLYLRRRQALSPEHAEEYVRATQTLGAIASGRLTLGGGNASRQRAESTTLDESPLFDDDSLNRF